MKSYIEIILFLLNGICYIDPKLKLFLYLPDNFTGLFNFINAMSCLNIGLL